MFRIRRMTALLVSVLLMGSTVCVPAMAAEAPIEEPGAVLEDIQQAEEPETEGAVTELPEDLENVGENVATEPVEQAVEPENAAEDVTAETAEPVEQAIEPENAAEDVTTEAADPVEKVIEQENTAENTTLEEEEPVKEDVSDEVESAVGTGKENAGSAEAEDASEEDEPILTKPVTEKIIDTKITTGTDGSSKAVAGEEPLFKVAASDVTDASEGRWEEIIETIHHDEQGHYEKVQTGTKTVIHKEAWDEQVYEMLAVCSVCGYTSDSTEDINNHLDVHYDPDLGYSDAGYSVQEVPRTIHHPAGTYEEPIYEYRWIVDTEAWDEKIRTGRMRYVVNGKAVTDSLVVIEGDTYYLDKNGSPVTGWKVVNGTWRYFDETGKMQTGWQKINGSWYYFNGNGVMQTGWPVSL